MWQHNYTPLNGSLLLSSLVAALPIFVLLFLLGVRRTPAWIAAVSGFGTTILVSFFLYGMPVERIVSAAAYGAAYGWFPIGWIVIWAVYLYRLTLDTGKFEIIKHSLRSLTRDPRLQTLLIAFAFGAFLEGAAGFGTPVAVAAAMLAGLGFSPFHAAAICLLANTAPVAFGSIAIPVVTLAGITGLPLMRLSAGVGRMCAPVSLIVPAYLVVVMGGWGALARVFPAALLCGVTFAGLQFAVSNFVGPQLTDLIASLCAHGRPGGAVHGLETQGQREVRTQRRREGGRKVGLFHRASVPGLEPLPFVGGLRSVVGLAAHAEAFEFGEHSDPMARLAQPDRAHSAGHRQGGRPTRLFLI